MDPHHETVIVGGGQAGLSASYCLGQRGIDHVVFERSSVGHAWRDERWDSFCLVTPNWQCTLPGFSYAGEYKGRDPDGFMVRDEILDYLAAYRAHFDPPLREGVAVEAVRRLDAGFEVLLAGGERCTADDVIVATGGYHRPKLPALASSLPDDVLQLHSSTYRRPAQAPEGAVLVVGNGQSGCQIAEDLHLAGRRVHLAVGSAPRAPRRHRGRDVTAWLVDMGHYDVTVDEHPQGEGVRAKVNHYMTGRDGGRDIDLRRFALEGMHLHGRLVDIAADASGTVLRFDDSLAANMDAADATALRIGDEIDRWIESRGIDAPPVTKWERVWEPEPGTSSLDLDDVSTVVWATGFATDYDWLDPDALDDRGYPDHWRGVSRRVDGLWVLGLPWLVTWGSGRFSGVGRDAQYIAARIEERRRVAERRSARVRPTRSASA